MSILQDKALDAVEHWAGSDYLLFRETGAVEPRLRVDGLLVPLTREAFCMRRCNGPFFERIRLVGVEVKASRSDFLRGLKKGQFDIYDGLMGGLYVVTYPDVCKASEIPKHIGHISLKRSFDDGWPDGWSAVCRRHPTLTDTHPSAETAWRLLFRSAEHHRARMREAEQENRERMEQVGRIAGRKVFAVIRQIERSIMEDQS